MNERSHSFSLTVDEAQGICPSGEQWAETNIAQRRIPVIACEGPCIRGDIARLVANLVAKEEPYSRCCYAEVTVVPQSAMSRWAKQSERIVMIDGCFLKCVGRILRNLVDDAKIVHIDALSYYMKYTDVFLMDDVPEAERKETARQVADKVLADLNGLESIAACAGGNRSSSQECAQVASNTSSGSCCGASGQSCPEP